MRVESNIGGNSRHYEANITMAFSVEDIFVKAVASIRDGRLAEAERQFKRVLQHQPKHVAALNLLAVLLTRLKRYPEAEHYVKSAIEVNSSSDATFYNYGIILRALDRPLEALEHFDKALAINASVPETWNNCGIVLNDLSRYDDAVIRFDRAIEIKPDYAEAFYNKGKSLLKLDQLEAASSAFDRALALKPNMAEGWVARGVLFSKLKRHGEARAAYLRAHALNPDMVESANPRVCWLLSDGKIGEALKLARRALADRETFETKSLVAFCFRWSSLHLGGDDPRDLLVRAMSEPWVQPAELAPACANFLVLNNEIRDSMERAAKAWPQLLPVEELASPSKLAKFAEDRLLIAILESAPIYGIPLEQFTTGLRFALLSAARSGNETVTEPVLRLYCAVAHQCFINNYVFAQSPAETEQLHTLSASIIAALASGAAIPVLSLLAVASYVPLHHLPKAESLLRQPWPDTVLAVLTRQLRAPLEERGLRASMQALTTIDDDVSIRVRDQYEENPYPQWVKATPVGDPMGINEYMREKLPESPFVKIDNVGDELSVLVAGCGTGHHSLVTARRFKDARVLAVDISLTSLGYAKRQTDALGVSNIEYAQADIMKLGSIGRTFDVIESVGVLHHLADPFGGWRVLLSLLRPGGVMLVGLYSETARRDVVAARDLIGKRGYRPTADGIRQCRQELFASADRSSLKSVTLITDFFSLSECRDLLFHVQETRHTLSDISAFVADNELTLIGFEVDPVTSRNYLEKFPDDIAMTNLMHWRQFETENPFTFRNMYNFWVQKKR
jgi:Tfp pilus assembly protein PilF/SAM-dependent methyltransferase